jgi:PKD repeat protein
VTWAWTFGDGTTGTGPMPAHTYAAPGTYVARLTVTDNNGAVASDDANIIVTNATWADAIGSTDNDSAYTVAVDGSGNTIVGGVIRGSVTVAVGKTLVSAGGADWFVAKFDPAGNCVWANRMGGTADDAVDAVTADASGNVIVTGRFAGSASFGGTTNLVANGTNDMAVAKYGADGHHIWSKRFGGQYDDAPSAAAVDTAGNVYLTGYFRGTCDFGGGPLTVPFTSDLDVFVAKLDPSGNHLWSKNFTNDGNDRGYGIATDSAGNVVVAGTFSNTIDFGGGEMDSPNAMLDVFVVKLSPAGAHLWSRHIGTAVASEGVNGVAIDLAGNVVIAGNVIAEVDFGGGSLGALGASDAYVAKYAPNGNHIWSRRFGGAGNDYASAVAVDGSGNVAVAGSFESNALFAGIPLLSAGQSDAYVLKLDPSGTNPSVRQLGGTSADVGQGVVIAPSGSLVTAGYFYGSGSFAGIQLGSLGAADAFIASLAP